MLRLPVRTQEPVEVRSRYFTNRTYLEELTGVGGALADYNVRIKVDPGKVWRVLSLVWRSVQNADTDQYFDFFIRDMKYGPGNIMFQDKWQPHSGNAIYYGSAAIGISRASVPFSVGAQAYVHDAIPLPDMVLKDGMEALFYLRNIDANSTYNLFMFYEEVAVP
ncbi:MAG: hypothetical protein WC551_13920 [Patescibacteria group bacterium]